MACLGQVSLFTRPKHFEDYNLCVASNVGLLYQEAEMFFLYFMSEPLDS